MSDTKTEMMSIADEDMYYLRDAHVAADVKWLQQFRDEVLLRQTVALERIADALEKPPMPVLWAVPGEAKSIQ